MKKLLYLTFLNEDIRPGYKNKIHAQCQGFSHIGLETELIIVNNNGLGRYCFRDKNTETLEHRESKRKRILKKRNMIDEFFLFIDWVEYVKEISLKFKPDIVYIRRVLPITPILIKLIKFLKNERIKIVYEYPTWPWEKEMLIEKQYIFYGIDKLFFSSLEKWVDKFSVIGDTYEIDNNKFIPITNGIDLNKVPLKKSVFHKENEIKLITVAHVSAFHGYDRLIEGLKNYYLTDPQFKVYFDIVGPIDKKLGLQNLVELYDLTKYVKFLGFKTGKELNDLFDTADIAVGCLGIHRKGIGQGHSLKNREFVARGIPFIFSEFDEAIEGGNPNFILKLPADNSAVQVDKIIEFYNAEKDTSEFIRKYAKDYLSWDVQMKRIVSNLK